MFLVQQKNGKDLANSIVSRGKSGIIVGKNYDIMGKSAAAAQNKRKDGDGKMKQYWKDALITAATLAAAFLLNLLVQMFSASPSLIPMLFVLGVFIVSLKTQGYFWGILASLIGVLLVNYAFTFPFYAIDLITPESLASAVIMLIVSLMTSSLTTKIKVQEKLKAESEKERMRANLLRAVSHDLRTPLTSIYGASATVAENYDSLSKEQHLKLIGDVCEDAQWMIRMVENLLSVTRIDGSKVQVIKTPTVLEELIDTVLVKFRKRCPHQRVQVQLPENFISIPMDAMLIEQVLINMLENAVDHAKGMTELTLSVQCKDNVAWFEVADNGCGISQERMKDLFTGYLDQGNTPADSTRSNMGIGLFVCATIVKAHGSEIHAENIPGGGAAFRFALEMEDSDE